MITLIAFDLDGTLAESKEAIKSDMAEALSELLAVAHVAIISSGDWPQFHEQIASRLPPSADLSKIWLILPPGPNSTPIVTEPSKSSTQSSSPTKKDYTSSKPSNSHCRLRALLLNKLGKNESKIVGVKSPSRHLDNKLQSRRKNTGTRISLNAKSFKPTFEHFSPDFPST